MHIKLLISLFLYIAAGQFSYCYADNKANTALLEYKHAMNYLLGRNGREKSPQKAAAIFKTLAEQNWRSAQHMLGNLYFKGQGLEKNDLLAYKWLSIAARDNLNLAESVLKKRKQLQARLSDMHLQQVERWIENWQPKTEQNLASTNQL